MPYNQMYQIKIERWLLCHINRVINRSINLFASKSLQNLSYKSLSPFPTQGLRLFSKFLPDLFFYFWVYF